jgi:hypothetical protein
VPERPRGRPRDSSHTPIARARLEVDFEKRRNGYGLNAMRSVIRAGGLTEAEKEVRDALAVIVYEFRRDKIATRKGIASFLRCNPKAVTALTNRGRELAHSSRE